jgi:hypothetical protein
MITRVDKIEEFLGNLDTTIDILSMVNAEDINSYDDLYEALENNNGFDVEIIYYASAMDYLRMHDSSLRCSITIRSCPSSLCIVNKSNGPNGPGK